MEKVIDLAFLKDNCSLEYTEHLYQCGAITLELLEQYLELWNAGPHFHRARYADGAVRMSPK